MIKSMLSTILDHAYGVRGICNVKMFKTPGTSVAGLTVFIK